MNFRHYLKHPGAILLLRNNITQKLKTSIDKKAFKWALKSPRRASFYYWFFNDRFDREHYSVLYGKQHNLNGDINSLGTDATLRRSLHMIEKGLTTEPTKPVFAENYIINTVTILKKMVINKCDDTTKKWAYDVLKRFFEVVQPTKNNQAAKIIFNDLIKDYPLISCEAKHHSPYKRKSVEKTTIDYDEFMHLCRQRRSIRWYEKKQVPIELIEKAIKAGLTAPSACNRQPFRFIVIKSSEILKKTVKMPMGTDTFAHNIQLMVILIGDLSAYFDERDRHLIYIDGALAAMNFMMALETMGLSSCPINWPDIEEREQNIAKEFNLSPSEKGIMFFSVGYPLNNGGIPYSAKKSVKQVTTIY